MFNISLITVFFLNVKKYNKFNVIYNENNGLINKNKIPTT